MAVSFVLPILALIALLLIGGLTGLVVLLANPRTRAVGVVLLVVGFMVVFLGGGLVLFTARASRSHVDARRRAMLHHQRMLGRKMAVERHRTRILRSLPETEKVDEVAEEPVESTEALEPWKGPSGSDGPTVEAGRPGDAAGPPGDEETIRPAETETAEAAPPEADTATDVPGEDESPAADAGAEPSSGAGEEPPPPETEPAEPGQPPSWVENPPRNPGNSCYYMVVRVGPYTSLGECEAQLPAALHQAVGKYAREQLKLGSAARRARLPLGVILDEIVKDTWDEREEYSVGPMIQRHVLLEFDQGANALIRARWRESVVTGRLWTAGTGVAALVGLLGVLLVSLKLDEATGGSCRVRVVVGAVVACLAIGAVAAMVTVSAEGVAPVGHRPAPAELSDSAFSGNLFYTGGALDPAAPEADAAGFYAVRKVGLLAAAAVLGLVGLVGLVLLLASRSTRGVGMIALGLALMAALFIVGPRLGWHTGVGPLELPLLLLATLAAVVLGLVVKNRWAWILGLLVCVGCAVLLTPPDPLSTMVVAVFLCGIYALTVFMWKGPRRSNLDGQPASKPEGLPG